jgi:hypothetical protein
MWMAELLYIFQNARFECRPIKVQAIAEPQWRRQETKFGPFLAGLVIDPEIDLDFFT